MAVCPREEEEEEEEVQVLFIHRNIVFDTEINRWSRRRNKETRKIIKVTLTTS